MKPLQWLCASLLALALVRPGGAAESVTAAFHAADAASAAAPVRRASRASVPPANFLVEWRLQPAVDRASARGDVVITSGGAATGASGYGPGAVVVGTARATPPLALRVANGKEGAIRFDRSETHTVYDVAWAASTSASASTDGTLQVVAGAASSVSAGGASRSGLEARQGGAESHEVVIHRVDGLRVTPRWTRGDTLELELALTHVTPTGASRGATAGARASRDVDFHSTVQASFDEWLTVGNVGEGGEELQIRVSWR
jgi:hypothetical protein